MDEYINLQTAKENIVSLTTYNGEEEIRQAVKSARYKEGQWIGGIHDALISLNEIPAADVVEVVRCKDCQLWGSVLDEEDRQRCIKFNTDSVCDYWMSDGLMPNDFCSFGERKEGEG